MTDNELLLSAVPRLIDWFRAAGRPLPWRQSPTPYHVWVSEIMLQQTRIEAVIPYYHRFLARLPDVKALADVPEEELLKLWEGLGYYSRARNLKKAAALLVSDCGGELPADAAALKRLPGIGDYTAGAIASIAFGRRSPAVDGNVLRVLLRLFASEEDALAPATKSRLTALLRDVYPEGEAAGLLTQGLMELGETICIPNGQPLCEACPLADFCEGRRQGVADRLPLRAPKKPRRVEDRTVLLLRCGDRYALNRRPPRGLLAGLWEFPSLPGHWTAEALSARFPEGTVEPLGETVHLFTHVEWHMAGFRIDCPAQLPGFTWETAAAIRERCAVPSAFRFFLRQL